MADKHPTHDALIDFVEGEGPAPRLKETEAHLETCRSCRAYVASVRRAFTALSEDVVPEPPPGYWEYFEQRVRARAKPTPAISTARSLVFRLVPGLAAAAALLLLFWLVPQPWAPRPPAAEFIMASMTTGEIMDAVSQDPYFGAALMEAAGEDIRQMEAYLEETEDVYSLVDDLDDAEMERLITGLKEAMQEESENQNEGARYLAPDDGSGRRVRLGKGC